MATADHDNASETFACAVCGERLAQIVETTPHGQRIPRGWEHRNHDIRPRDHPAVPVPITDVVEQVEEARCDFCSRTPVTDAFPITPFEWAPGQGSGDQWYTCQPCAALLSRNDWRGLLRRAESGVLERSGQAWTDEVRDAMAGVYRRLRKAMR